MPDQPEAYPSCRFYVMFGGEAQGLFTEVSGLQLEVDVMDYQEGGWNNVVYHLPGSIKVSNLTLKRGMTCSNEFYKWFAEVTRGTIKRRNVTVVMYDVGGKELMKWNFSNAYPVKWIGPQLQASEAATAIETLELAHEGMTVG